jgi:hypothetical protein
MPPFPLRGRRPTAACKPRSASLRRYLDHGFVDAAMRIFARRAPQVAADDWQQLVTRLPQSAVA